MFHHWTDVEYRLARISGRSQDLGKHLARMPIPYRRLLAPLLQPNIVFPAVLRQLFTPRLQWPFTREALGVATVLAHVLCDLMELLTQPSDQVNKLFVCEAGERDRRFLSPPATLLGAIIRIVRTESERALVTLVTREAASRLEFSGATPALVMEARCYSGPFWLLGFSAPFITGVACRRTIHRIQNPYVSLLPFSVN